MGDEAMNRGRRGRKEDWRMKEVKGELRARGRVKSEMGKWRVKSERGKGGVNIETV